MWRWHSTLVAAATLWFSTVGLPSGVDTSRGPVSEEEGRILWADGASAAREGRCSEAIAPLSRIVDRYPGHEGYIRSHLLLGECLLKLNDTKAAIQRLRYFTSGSTSESSPESAELNQRGRSLLARAYLKEGRNNEAALAAAEMLRKSPGSAEGLVLKSRAQIGLGQVERAEKTLGDASSKVSANAPSWLRGELAWTKLSLETHRCEKLPAKGRMDEGQARNQIERRGTCLLGAVIHARDTLHAQDAAWAAQAVDQARRAVNSFGMICKNPPAPPKAKRTKQERDKYRSELADILARDCAAKISSGLGMLDGWRTQLPESSKPYLGSIREAFASELKRLGS